MNTTTMIAESSSKIVTDQRTLSALADEWRSLERCCAGPIEQFEWSKSCIEGLKGAGRLRIHTIWEDNRCVAIAPLALRTLPLPRLESLGVEALTEPMDFVYLKRDHLARLCAELAQRRLPILLPRVPAESPLIEELHAAFKGKALIRVVVANPYPTLRLDQTWTTPESRFNSGRRSDFRRALRHASSTGPTEFQMLAPGPSEAGSSLAEAYDVEMRAWQGRAGSALALDPLRADFYRRYLQACSEKGILRIAFMRIDGKPIAMQIAIEASNRLWLLKIGHDEAHSKCSPGTLLMLHVVRYAAERQLESIEFLGTADPWTRLWTDHVRECRRVLVCPYGIAGLALYAADTARITVADYRKRKARARE